MIGKMLPAKFRLKYFVNYIAVILILLVLTVMTFTTGIRQSSLYMLEKITINVTLAL